MGVRLVPLLCLEREREEGRERKVSRLIRLTQWIIEQLDSSQRIINVRRSVDSANLFSTSNALVCLGPLPPSLFTEVINGGTQEKLISRDWISYPFGLSFFPLFFFLFLLFRQLRKLSIISRKNFNCDLIFTYFSRRFFLRFLIFEAEKFLN